MKPSLSPLDNQASLIMSGSGLQSPINSSKSNPSGKNSSFSHQNQGNLMPYNSMDYQPTRKMWDSNQKSGLSYNKRKEGYTDTSTETTRGPRANRESNSSKTSSEDGQQGLNFQRDIYNLEEFQHVYDSAKFFVIKSFSEDDIHKSIKYKVWSSTPNGNEKLNHVFLDADAEAAKTGTKQPVFLVFSVNGSGQFVGVAEMIGPVDFNKNMDFWQVDWWKGFFPVKWHIIKDVPSYLFHHIILENNYFKAVTNSRDTQEVGLKEGVEMLRIFKSHSSKKSLLDDFCFYDNRERSLKTRRRCKSVSQTNDIYNARKVGEQSETYQADSMPSLVKLANNLAI